MGPTSLAAHWQYFLVINSALNCTNTDRKRGEGQRNIISAWKTHETQILGKPQQQSLPSTDVAQQWNRGLADVYQADIWVRGNPVLSQMQTGLIFHAQSHQVDLCLYFVTTFRKPVVVVLLLLLLLLLLRTHTKLQRLAMARTCSENRLKMNVGQTVITNPMHLSWQWQTVQSGRQSPSLECKKASIHSSLAAELVLCKLGEEDISQKKRQ